jgi:hypothetical protein
MNVSNFLCKISRGGFVPQSSWQRTCLVSLVAADFSMKNYFVKISNLQINVVFFLELLFDECKAEYDRLFTNGLLQTTEVFTLAQKMREAIKTVSHDVVKKLKELQAELPLNVQILIWKKPTAIYNKAYPGEYIYAYSGNTDPNLRNVFSWVPGGSVDSQGKYLFATQNGGETFLIKSLWANEYLFSDSLFDPSRRDVFTWRKKTLKPTFYWKVELLNFNEVRLKSITNQEYFYAETNKFNFNNQRRQVFTGVGRVCDDSCNWILELLP